MFKNIFSGAQVRSESKFETVGIGIGFLNLEANNFGVNAYLDIAQISQGLAQKSDIYSSVLGSVNINYSMNEFIYLFSGLNGSMNYVKTDSNSWYYIKFLQLLK